MVTDNHYRWDFIGLSTDEKPTPATSDKVVDGSTFYCSDNSKLYVFCKTQWYEKTAPGGGGTTYTAGDGIDITNDTISVDTTTIQPKLTAGTNITIDENNEISATDTTYSNFTGTDGTAAGAAGLVPAPATTDAGKFLKADGTWDTAGGGGGQSITTLTTADLTQYASGIWNNDIGLWKLPPGIYVMDGVTGTIKNQSPYLNKYRAYKGALVIITGEVEVSPGTGMFNPYRETFIFNGNNNSAVECMPIVSDYYGVRYLTFSGSTGQNTDRGMTQKAITDFVNSAVINGGDTAPTTATVGSVGTLYTCVESGTPHLYTCTAVSGSTYTWSQLI